MALSSTDPKVLMGQAKCFNCLTPHQQLQDQTYLLATIGKFSTTAAGVRALAAASNCFSCLTIFQLKRVKQYLLATWLGLDTSLAGVQALIKAAACVTCLTPRQQQTVETYLLAVTAGAGTNAAGVQAIEAASACFDCPTTKQQYEFQVYILAQLANVTSTAPADLVSAARCFISCLPFELEEALQASLIIQTASQSTTPCLTPSHPFLVQVAQKGVTDTNTQLSVRWQQLGNAGGTLITGYVVYWGTTSGGPYTNNSGPLPVTPKFYIITGLTSGTTYYVVVQATTQIVGCVSTNSSEVNGTTTGNPPGPTLLDNLAAYWKLDDLSNANRIDSTGNGELLTDTNGNTPAGAGLINNGVGMPVGGSATELLKHADDAVIGIGAGVSFSISCWFNQAGHDIPIVTKWNTGNAALQDYRIYVGTNGNFGNGFFWFSVKNLAGVAVDLVSNVQCTAAFHHIAAGYDDALQTIWIQVDNGVRISAPCVGVRRTAVDFLVGNYANGSTAGGTVDEVAFYRRSISTTDVSKLYNGGAGIQYPFAGAAAGTIGSTLSAYTSAWWNSTVYPNSGDASNNGGPLSNATLAALDGLLTAITTGGLLPKVYQLNGIVPDNIVAAMWPFLGIAGAQPAAKWTNHNFVGVGTDLSVNGLLGNGTTKYADTGIAPNAFATLSQGALVLYGYQVNNTGGDLGIFTNGDGDAYLDMNQGGSSIGDIMTSTVNRIVVAPPGNGYFCISRTANNAESLYFANSLTPHAAIGNNVNVNANNPKAINIFLSCLNVNGVPTSFSNNTISAAGLFLGISSTESQTLFNALQAYLVAKGGGFR